MSTPSQIARHFIGHRHVIWAMAIRDLQARYAGSIGGFLWALAQPLALVTVYYFVFAVGFRAQGPQGTPFVPWFVAGLVPWLFFSETLQAITHSVIGNSHLVKKTLFPTETLPMVNLIAGLLPHAVFLLLLLGLLFGYGISLRPERLLVVYFLGCTCLLLIGLGWVLASLQVFFRDVGHGLSIILNIWFWVTPIVWHRELIPDTYWRLLSLNPVQYIVEGYRGVLISSDVHLPSIESTACFWGITLLLLLLGYYTFNRLKPEFPDVM